jgi:hypothetical protein
MLEAILAWMIFAAVAALFAVLAFTPIYCARRKP